MQTETRPPDPAPGEASPPPAALLVVLWIGAFAAIAWGMSALFRRRPAAGTPPFGGPTGPGKDDDTLEEPRP